MLIREKISTSLIIPKIIFLLTVFLVILTIVLGYMFIFVDAQTIVNEASHFTVSFQETLSTSDNIEATLNP